MRKLYAVILAALTVLVARAAEPTVEEDRALAALLAGAPRTTCTRNGIPGDPLNIALVGTREELCSAFAAIGWYPADPITARSSVGIAVSVTLNVPYPTAPLSSLYLFGRPQDLAFQLPVGSSARTRHHARFWCAGPVQPGCEGGPTPCPSGRLLWLGADTFNLRVGLSPNSRLPTHRIDPDIDRERDFLMGSLMRCGLLVRSFHVPHLGCTVGRNGEGDWYFTDSNMAVGILRCQ